METGQQPDGDHYKLNHRYLHGDGNIKYPLLELRRE